MTRKISPSRVRYIKLGKKGLWEQECLKKNILRLGFGSQIEERFLACQNGKWDQLAALFVNNNEISGSATRFRNECRFFWEDDGKTLWITFIGDRLYWAFLAPDEAERHPDGDGIFRRVAGKWKSTDIMGNFLMKSVLAGSLTKLAAYRATSCKVGGDTADYIVRRINGEKKEAVEKALKSLASVHYSALDVIRLLQPKDFELLVELVFSSSGWRRIGYTGKTQKNIDLDLMLPSTQEHAFVQVKSKTTTREFAYYVSQFKESEDFDRMFYVFHSGNIETEETGDDITIVGPEKIAKMVVDAGLLDWVIQKVS